MGKIKLYCYVDETGQDTEGKFFLVSVVITEQNNKDELGKLLENIENDTGKNKVKWSKSSFEVRKSFLLEIAKIPELRHSIFYSIYSETKEYTNLTAHSIAKAVLAKGETEYTVKVIVDGLTKKNAEEIRGELKKLKIKYKDIRGMRDEQSVFIRLADYIAGFVRDHIEKCSYTKAVFSLLKKKEILVEA